MTEENNEYYNRIVLIGNGFDIAAGLKKKYSDFLLYLIKKECTLLTKKQVLNRGVNLDSHKFLKFKNWDILSGGQDLVLIKDIEACSDLVEIKNVIKGKIYFKYDPFNRLLNIQKVNWVDVEAFYFKELKDAFDTRPSMNLFHPILKLELRARSVYAELNPGGER